MNELDTLIVNVRADTAGFSRDVGSMRADLEGPLGSGVDAAERRIETALSKAITSGRVGFADLGKIALATLAEIAASAVKADLGALFGGGSSGGNGGGLLSSLAGVASSLFGGSPGRATGGPVTGGRPYMVGERGPELFVPTSAGSIQPASAGGERGPVNITVNVAAAGGSDDVFMQRTGAQVARAVRQSLDRAAG